jgi:hypothetical protein
LQFHLFNDCFDEIILKSFLSMKSALFLLLLRAPHY